MIVVFSRHWRGETKKNVYHNRIEMRKRGIYFTKVNGVTLNDLESDSDSDDGSESESDDSDCTEVIGDDTNEPDDYNFDSDDHSDSSSPYGFDDDIDWGDFTDSYDFDPDLGDLQDFDDNVGDHCNSYDVTDNSDDDSSDQNDVTDFDDSEIDDFSDVNEIILYNMCSIVMDGFCSDDSYNSYDDEEYD